MSGEAQLLLAIFAIHVLGIACVAALLLPAFMRSDEADQPPESGSDDGRGNDRLRPGPRGERPRGGIPLPDAQPASIRLRDHHRLIDQLPRRERRPTREPARQPAHRPGQ